MRDLSRQVESERTQRRQAAIEAAGDGIGIIGPDGTLSYMNGAMKGVYGISEEEEFKYAGKGWDVLYEGSDLERMNSTVFPVVLRTGYWSGELDITRRDGKRIWVEMSLDASARWRDRPHDPRCFDRKREEKEKKSFRPSSTRPRKWRPSDVWRVGSPTISIIFLPPSGYAEF